MVNTPDKEGRINRAGEFGDFLPPLSRRLVLGVAPGAGQAQRQKLNRQIRSFAYRGMSQRCDPQRDAREIETLLVSRCAARRPRLRCSCDAIGSRRLGHPRPATRTCGFMINPDGQVSN